MTIKKNANIAGRMIRQLTGMPFLVAKVIGKKIAQGEQHFVDISDLPRKFPEHYQSKSRYFTEGGENFVFITLILSGPKGSFEFPNGITIGDLKERVAQ